MWTFLMRGGRRTRSRPRVSRLSWPEQPLVDLVEKLRLPEEYVPTDYHWLLMLYECLQGQIEALNEDPLPLLVNLLTTLATAQDALYLTLPTRSTGGAGFSIDFDALVDMYFWDTDFLLDAEQLPGSILTRRRALASVLASSGYPGTCPAPGRACLAKGCGG